MPFSTLKNQFWKLFQKRGSLDKYSYTNKASIYRPTPLYLWNDENIHIPYEDLWSSAVRCKFVHCEKDDMSFIWHLSNVPQDTEITPDIDELYIREMKDVSLPICLHTHGSYEKVSIKVYIWNSQNTVFITFYTDPDSEARFLRVPMKLHPIFGDVCVNRFLYLRLLSVIGTIICYLDIFKNRQCTLMLAGYSLGATMAQIASAILAGIFPDFYIKCHAFGGMKPGNDAFARWSASCVHESYRIVNGNDPFVFLPIHYRWCHTSCVTLHFEKHLYVNVSYKEAPWYKRFIMQRQIIRHILRVINKSNDHPFDKYIEELWGYTRMAKYLHSMSEAELPLLTPIGDETDIKN